MTEEKCSKCGAIYKVKAEKIPMKDKDFFRCNCGNIMKEWKGTTIFSYELIKEREEDRQK